MANPSASAALAFVPRSAAVNEAAVAETAACGPLAQAAPVTAAVPLALTTKIRPGPAASAAAARTGPADAALAEAGPAAPGRDITAVSRSVRAPYFTAASARRSSTAPPRT
jgi:hypothetical protein